jgi:hypothetical protein
MVEGGQCPDENSTKLRQHKREWQRLEQDQMNANAIKDTYSEGVEHGIDPPSPVGGGLVG